MLRILHTSDWHLGKRLERFSRHEEQVAVLDEIIGIAEQQNVDIILVAGDLFDTFNPPAESLDLFYKSLKRLADNGKRPVIAIAGNHDMPERIEAPDPLARECGILFAGFPESEMVPFTLEQGLNVTQTSPGFVEIKLPGKPVLRLLLTPYANEMRLRKGLDPENAEQELRNLLSSHWKALADKYCDEEGVNVLLSHLLFMPEGGVAPEEPEDERPINHIGGAQAIFTSSIPKSIQYVALGHLHRKQRIAGTSCPVIYSGSPLSYSFSEAGQQKQLIIIDLEPRQEAIITPVFLTRGKILLRKRFENILEAESWLADHPNTLVELTLVTDNYLSGADRRRLQDIHEGIVAIIPEIKGTKTEETRSSSNAIQLKNLQELFSDYFRNKKGQEPDQVILELFNEINATEEEV